MNTNDAEQSTKEKIKDAVSEAFRGKVILITGATGFVGKVLLEKLLRSCPGISQVILLLRSHKKECSQKFRDLMESGVFERIRNECPDALLKVCWIAGDANLENWDLPEQDLKRIKEDVSFVFHCAASVRFDGDPKETFTINLLGVKNVLDICREMPKLEALVHVSTAYSFCNQEVVCEEIYPERFGPKRILDCLTWMNTEQLKALCKKLVDRPTLYHYSKALAEIYLAENHGNLPVVIVRPSIITATYKDPFPGWIDNYNGPTGFIALSSKGIIRTLLVDPKITANWVPVDIVANTLIVSAYVTSMQRNSERKIIEPAKNNKIPIVNCICPERNSKTWLEIINIIVPLLSKYPSSEFFRQPGGGTVTSSHAVHYLLKMMTHYVPAFWMDILKFRISRPFGMIKNYRRIHGVMDNLQHYTTHQFVFHSSNMNNLITNMSETDKEIFTIDQLRVDWKEYMENYVHGVRKYFLKESDSTLDAARSRLRRYQGLWLGWKIVTSIATLMYLNHRYLKISPSFIARYLLKSKLHVLLNKKI